LFGRIFEIFFVFFSYLISFVERREKWRITVTQSMIYIGGGISHRIMILRNMCVIISICPNISINLMSWDN